MTFTKKYTIEELDGISNPKYFLNRMHDFFIENNFNVKLKNDVLRIRRKFWNPQRYIFQEAKIHIYIENDKMVMDFHTSNFFRIAWIFFSINFIVMGITQIYFPTNTLRILFFLAGLFAFGFLFNSIAHYFISRRIFKTTDELIFRTD